MRELAGDAQIAFEGDLIGLNLAKLRVVSEGTIPELKRQTLSPKQDFVVVELNADAIPGIMKVLGGTIPRAVIHIQIAKAGQLAFSACDNFDPDAIFFGEALSDDFVAFMQREHLLRELR